MSFTIPSFSTRKVKREKTVYYIVEYDSVLGTSGSVQMRYSDFEELKKWLRKENREVYKHAASMNAISPKPEERQVQLAKFLSKLFRIANPGERKLIRVFLESKAEQRRAELIEKPKDRRTCRSKIENASLKGAGIGRRAGATVGTAMGALAGFEVGAQLAHSITPHNAPLVRDAGIAVLGGTGLIVGATVGKKVGGGVGANVGAITGTVCGGVAAGVKTANTAAKKTTATMKQAKKSVKSAIRSYKPGSIQRIERNLAQLEKASICAALSTLVYNLQDGPNLEQELELPGLAVKAKVEVFKLGSPQWALCHVSNLEHHATAKECDVLVFRGSNTSDDWMTNFQFTSKPAPELVTPDVFVHAGMEKVMQANWPEISQKLHEHCRAAPINTPLWLAGHSLGGGYAQYALARLLREGAPCDPAQLQACTFGAPPIFASARDASSSEGTHSQTVKLDLLMAQVHQKLQIYVHGSDPVPRLTKKFGYAALGSFHFISKDEIPGAGASDGTEEAGGPVAVYEGTREYSEVRMMLKDQTGFLDPKRDHNKRLYAEKLVHALGLCKKELPSKGKLAFSEGLRPCPESILSLFDE